MFRLGYNTNGLSFHRIGDAIDLLADLGYEGIAITPDVGPLDPFELDRRTVADVRQRLDDAGLEVAIETGARYVLDPRRKHRPTLLESASHERDRRVDFLRRSIDLAVDRMGSDGRDLGLTLDVGHCVVTGDEPVSAVVEGFAERLVHVHLDDCPRGRHVHLPFGEGDLDLRDALHGLITCGFDGMAAVELSRDGHRAPEAARDALETLRGALGE